MKDEGRVGGPYEYGQWTNGGQGSRTDVSALKSLIDSGGSLADVWDAEPLMFLKYSRSIQLALLLKSPQRSWKTTVHVLVGPTGTGKSSFAALSASMNSSTGVYYKPRGEWWDGYTNQESVILDDFYGWVPYDELLRVLDRYPHRVPIKGGFVNFVAKHLYITINTDASKWYKNEKILGTIDSLIRRVDYWYFFPELGKWDRYSQYMDYWNNPRMFGYSE